MSELALSSLQELKIVDDYKCEKIFDNIKHILIKSLETHKPSRYSISPEELYSNLKEHHTFEFGKDNLALMDTFLTLFWEKNINKKFGVKKRI
jgi:hypothetical protein